MELEPTSPGVRLAAHPDAILPAAENLGALLFGNAHRPDAVPPLADLTSAVLSLARARQPKALIPLEHAPLEVALVRHGDVVRVSLYETGPVPEVILLDRPVELSALVEASRRALVELGESDGAPVAVREIALHLAERADRLDTVALSDQVATPVLRTGGAADEPGSDVPLAFGFRAWIPAGQPGPHDGSARADLHALLFRGELWAFARGKRVPLARGPIVLAVARMIGAVRALVDAWEAGRPANVRVRARELVFGVRHEADVSLTLGGERAEPVTLPALDVPSAALPVLKLGSELMRALLAVDRAQAKNLRVRALRQEVRELRRRIRARRQRDGFVNEGADLLRARARSGTLGDETRTDDDGVPALRREPAPTRLRFAERWSAEVDELDATSAFLCGDRLVVATPRRAVALDRNDGSVLWAREGLGGSSHMAGTVLVRRSPDGHVELCSVADGEPIATTRVALRGGELAAPIHVAGSGLPPTVVLAESEHRVVGIDLRNGDHRFALESRGAGGLRIARAGRLLVATADDGVVDAVDVATGETVWRYANADRIPHAPVVSGDVACVVAVDGAGKSARLVGIDLYRGAERYAVTLPAVPCGRPLAAPSRVIVPIGPRRRAVLAGYRARTGEQRFTVADPGIASGGAALAFDRTLLVNAPGGRVTALSIDDGHSRWSVALADPSGDDLPRRLEPVLRGGAVFLPSARVHVVRPTDGTALGPTLACSLVPDLLRVDERGWVYVAEESGLLAAFAPVPHLALVR